MTAGVPGERAAELLAQTIRLSVQKGVHEAPPLDLPGPQDHLHVPKVTLELGQHLFQRVPLPGPAQGHLVWPVGAHDEDPALPSAPLRAGSDTAAQAEQQPDGCGIGPLEIIQHQQQGSPRR